MIAACQLIPGRVALKAGVSRSSPCFRMAGPNQRRWGVWGGKDIRGTSFPLLRNTAASVGSVRGSLPDPVLVVRAGHRANAGRCPLSGLPPRPGATGFLQPTFLLQLRCGIPTPRL